MQNGSNISAKRVVQLVSMYFFENFFLVQNFYIVFEGGKWTLSSCETPWLIHKGNFRSMCTSTCLHHIHTTVMYDAQQQFLLR